MEAASPNVTYASGISYAPHGAVSALTLGNSTSEQSSYNSRLQMSGLSVSAPNTTGSPLNLLTLGYCYGVLTQAGACSETSNNGNLMIATIAVGTSWSATQKYPATAYDGVNRLTQAGEVAANSSQNWSETYGGNGRVRAPPANFFRKLTTLRFR